MVRSLPLFPLQLRSPISGLGCAAPSFLSQLRIPNPLRDAQLFLMPLRARTTARRGPSPHLQNVRQKEGLTYLIPGAGGFLSLAARLLGGFLSLAARLLGGFLSLAARLLGGSSRWLRGCCSSARTKEAVSSPKGRRHSARSFTSYAGDVGARPNCRPGTETVSRDSFQV